MEKLSHVIYVAYQPLTPKFEQDFFVKKISEGGFKVEYWDLSQLYHRDLITNETLSKDFIKYFFSFEQLKQELRKYKSNSVFIFNINYYAHVYKLFRIFSREDCLTAFFARGMIPFPLFKKSFFQKVVKRFSYVTEFNRFKDLILNQFAAIAKKLGWVEPFSIVFSAGSEGVHSVGYGSAMESKSSVLVPVNGVDYDKYLEAQKSDTRILERKYCVFLDDYLPYHPDFDILKIKKVNATGYYNSLNLFFDKIESAFKIKVVIAAHPKSDYSDKSAYLNRTVIKYKTAELVKDSEFVMAHMSTSIAFAVLFKKPILFLYNNEIIKTYPDRHFLHILYFAKILNAPSINVDNISDANFPFQPDTIDVGCYEDYKYKYLTSRKSEMNTSEEIFVSYLKSLR